MREGRRKTKAMKLGLSRINIYPGMRKSCVSELKLDFNTCQNVIYLQSNYKYTD